VKIVKGGNAVKRCARCQSTRIVADFTKDRTRKDGLDPWCRGCKRAHYAINKVAYLLARRKYYHENSERLRAEKRDWSEKHKASKAEYDRRYRSSHRKEILARKRRWAQANPDAANRWKRDNPQKMRRYKRAWAKAHPEYGRARENRRRARLLSTGGSYTIEEWEGVCARYGWRCLACGRPDIEIDHVIPLSRGGMNTIDNLQPLYRTCNARKGARVIDFRMGPAA
jgi:5-methylcytosine-specific restriction endonuclease McrA